MHFHHHWQWDEKPSGKAKNPKAGPTWSSSEVIHDDTGHDAETDRARAAAYVERMWTVFKNDKVRPRFGISECPQRLTRDANEVATCRRVTWMVEGPIPEAVEVLFEEGG